MLPIQTILHATDFSPRSEYAMRLASALARDYGAKLIVLHVVPPPVVVPMNGLVPLTPEDTRARVEAKLHEIRAADPNLPVHHRIADGDPVYEILKVAHEVQADLIVLGTHGWTGLARLLMGSVAEGVVRKAHCPVLTVKMPDAVEKVAQREPQLATA